MAINFNIDPYFDDYNENKNFHRILFRPGASVQARELTQLQTILQKQIERHGSHVFKDGSKVFGGDLTYNGALDAVKIQSLFGVENVEDYAAELVGTNIRGGNSGVTAKVVAYSPATQTDPLTIYVNYTGTGIDRVTSKFAENEELICESSIFTYQAGVAVAQTVTTDATAVGSGCSITTGVFYVNGFFVLAEEQFYVISKYTNDVDGRIGLKVVESIVTSSEDDTLLDNASGTTNFDARGADRYAIDLQLTHVDLNYTDLDFIEFERIRNGILQGKTRTTIYNELSKTLARQIYDINGNFAIDPFTVRVREALNDYLNEGVYDLGDTSNDGNLIDDDSYFNLQVSEGKAYVFGYEIENIGSRFVDVEKPRDSNTIKGAISTLEVGNFVRVNKLSSLPDIVGTTNIIDYPVVKFYDEQNTVDGTPNGNLIGTGRIRSMEFSGGDEATGNQILDPSSSVFKLFLFDIKMMSKIILDQAALADDILTGSYVQGQTSKAFGYVNSASTSTELYLTNVSGTFLPGEALISNNSHGTDRKVRNTSTGFISVQSLDSYAFDAAKQVYFEDTVNTPAVNFTANLVLESQTTLTGTVSTNGTTSVAGFNTSFLTQLRAGDVVTIGGSDYIVDSVTDNENLTLTATAAAVTSPIVRKRSFINDQDKNLSLRKLRKDYTKTLLTAENGGSSLSSITVRRQFYATADSSGSFTLTAGANETFSAESNLDYQIVIIKKGIGGGATGTGNVGDIINVDSSDVSITGDGTNSLTVTSGAIFGENGDLIKINTTLTQSNVNSKDKTNIVAARTKVTNKKNVSSGEIPWGTSADHSEISLGVADATKILAIYDSNQIGVDAVTPTMTITNITGSFTAKETIVGQTSGASAIIINSSSPLQYVPLTTVQFVDGETIEGSSASATITALSVGSTNITSRYLLDTGQRDNFYDISKLVLKQRAPKPNGDLLIVYNYFTHGSGNFLDVDSYTSIGSNYYKEIPFYTSTRIDPEVRSPTGVYDLRSVIDYRPRVADIDPPASINDVKVVNSTSFDFESRSYGGSGASVSETPKDNSNFAYDFEHYLARRDALWLTSQGEWYVAKGNPAENPLPPEDIPNAMLIANITMAPYVISLDDISLEVKSYKLYRMEDLEKIRKRLDNVEYYTSLSLLEAAADTLQIKDANGLDRFKSGFLVDSFGGHKTGDTVHQDYRIAIDMTRRELRPKYSSKNISLEESPTGLSNTYVINDNIVTLPYTHVTSIDQPYATRIESLTPALNSQWVGRIKLDPSADTWFETKYAPDVTQNVEGNYNSVLQANRNSLGTIWGASQQSWSGFSTTETESTRRRTSFSWNGATGATTQSTFNETVERTITTANRITTQEGVNTAIIERIDTKLDSDRIVAQDLIPFMRSKEITFTGTGFKPYTRVYPFFDNVNISNYCVSLGGAVVGTVTQTPSAGLPGQWSSISRIQFPQYWCHNHVSGSTVFKIETSTDNVNWTVVHTDEWTSRSSSIGINVTGLNITPNSKGEVYIRTKFENPDHMQFRGGVKIYDQAGVEISYDIIDLEDTVGITVPGRIFNSLLSPPRTNLRPRNRPIFFNFKISDGSKTVLPNGGVITGFDNTTLSENALVTDSIGRVSGVFTIPNPNVVGNPKFRTGKRTFRLTSSPNDSETNLITSGEGEFTSKGVLNTRQKTYVATRNAEIQRTSVSRQSVQRVTVSSNTRVVDRELVSQRTFAWRDPLAQTFQIITNGGEFLTKVDVYFAERDDFIPVKLQLVEVENGTPTQRIIPGSVVTLDPVDVLTSTNGSVATTFEFDHPIYVKEGVELAMVLMTDSEQYRVFISKLGEANILDNAVVSRQPYLGVLFKSQNASTWTPYDNEDLKFTIYRAKFDTNQGTLVLKNSPVENETLQIDPIESFTGVDSNKIKVYHDDHDMYDQSNYVEISGVTSGITSTLSAPLGSGDLSMTFPLVSGMPTSGTVMFRLTNSSGDVGEYATNDEDGILEEVVEGTVSEAGGVVTVSSLTRAIVNNASDFPATTTVVELYEINGIKLNEVNKLHTSIYAYGLDYYVLNLATSTATTASVFGGSNVVATQNALVNSYQLMVPTAVSNNTSITSSIQFAAGKNAAGSQTPFTLLSSAQANFLDIVDLQTPGLIASSVNEEGGNVPGGRSCILTMTLNSTLDNLSPVIDLERATISTFANRLDAVVAQPDAEPFDTKTNLWYASGEEDPYKDPTTPEGDSGEAIYITKRVQLSNPATAIKVYLDSAIMSSAGIQVMYKTLRSDDSGEFDEMGWKYFNTNGNPDTAVNPSVSTNDFKEYEFSVDDIPEFIAFSIKIRLTGTNGCEVPKVKNLRAIALAV
jgi:hypothetical protein